jgi:hypothetical protein
VACGDDFAPVTIPAGATQEQIIALIAQALSACGPKRVFDDPGPAGPSDPGPIDPDDPPVQLYFSREAYCTTYCSTAVTVVNGAPVVTRTGAFTYTLPAGSFVAFTQDAADSSARALACLLAAQHRLCLSDLAKAFCIGEGFEAIIKATGQYISQFPHTDYWTISGALPTGLTFHGGFVSGGKAVIDGTPTMAGLYTFTVKITIGSGLGQGDHMEKTYTLAIVEIDTASALPALEEDVPYLQNLSLIPSHDQETEAWSIVDGELPLGLELTTAGVLHGTPEETGAFPFTAQVTAIVNGTSITCEKDFTFGRVPDPFVYYKCEALDGTDAPEAIIGKVMAAYPPGNVPTIVPGFIDNCYNTFTRGLQRGGDADFNLLAGGTVGCTIRFWLKIKVSNPHNGFAQLFDSTFAASKNISFDHNVTTPEDCRVRLRNDAGTQFTVVTAGFLIDTWHHIVVTIDPVGGTMKLYLDAGAPTSVAVAGPFVEVMDAIRLSWDTGYGQASQLVDEIAIWKQVLTDAEIALDYNSGTGQTWPW